MPQNTVDVLWTSRVARCMAHDYKDGLIPAHEVNRLKIELQRDVNRLGITLEAAAKDAAQLEARRTRTP